MNRRKFFSAPLAVPGIVAAATAPALASGGFIGHSAASFVGEHGPEYICGNYNFYAEIENRIVASVNQATMISHKELLKSVERQFGRISQGHALRRS